VVGQGERAGVAKEARTGFPHRRQADKDLRRSMNLRPAALVRLCKVTLTTPSLD
jgi:hypothetical protein